MNYLGIEFGGSGARILVKNFWGKLSVKKLNYRQAFKHIIKQASRLYSRGKISTNNPLRVVIAWAGPIYDSTGKQTNDYGEIACNANFSLANHPANINNRVHLKNEYLNKLLEAKALPQSIIELKLISDVNAVIKSAAKDFSFQEGENLVHLVIGTGLGISIGENYDSANKSFRQIINNQFGLKPVVLREEYKLLEGDFDRILGNEINSFKLYYAGQHGSYKHGINATVNEALTSLCTRQQAIELINKTIREFKLNEELIRRFLPRKKNLSIEELTKLANKKKNLLALAILEFILARIAQNLKPYLKQPCRLSFNGSVIENLLKDSRLIDSFKYFLGDDNLQITKYYPLLSGVG